MLASADIEWVRTGVMVVHLIVTISLGVGLYWLGGKARKFEGLENALQKTTEKLIEERLSRITHDFKNHMQPLNLALDEMKLRLKEGEADYRGLGDRDQKIELTLAGKIDALKDYIRENAASKEDLESHEKSMERKVEKIEGQIGDLRSDVAVLSDRMMKM